MPVPCGTIGVSHSMGDGRVPDPRCAVGQAEDDARAMEQCAGAGAAAAGELATGSAGVWDSERDQGVNSVCAKSCAKTWEIDRRVRLARFGEDHTCAGAGKQATREQA